MSLGAVHLRDRRCRFRVWAPLASRVDIRFLSPKDRLVPMEAMQRGYYQVILENIKPGSLYFYRLEEKERPDPASRSQPQGVQGPSQVIDPNFPWDDSNWFGLPLRDYIIYELHVGTFTPEGTFDAIIPHLQELRELGVTAVELMPVAQFPGNRNWGYDGVYPFAAQNSYGGPEGLKKLVNACHRRGLAVILDVVYNHLGPEGNYLGDFGPYFTERYKSPWAPALNFDGPYSDEVRRFFIENALYWITEFHIDALRLDAVHAILDHSSQPFLLELGEAVHARAKQLNRRIYLIPESAANDARLIRSRELGGYGLDAQWSDDFHHSLRVLLTGDRSGYYQDYGRVEQLVKAFREGFVYSGEYSPFRRRRHGSSSQDIPAERFVVFAQNHDQVGNRILGDRLSRTVSFETLKLAAGAVILSPFIPLLFMGEEYGETAPFQYFISHSDPELVEAVRRGRREEFREFQWKGEIADPQDVETFQRAKLNHLLRYQAHHQVLHDLYRELIRLRRTIPALARLSKQTMDVRGYEKDRVLLVRRWTDNDEIFIILTFAQKETLVSLPVPEGHWHKLVDSADERWRGGGTLVPKELDSEGEISLHLNPTAVALFARSGR
ncbi:MAG: malto-oligosyltrehalose trehalohydrolase [Deltaproteobacteria bacterium]|nr:malto-oligosyltrehalose trehalohydrolase [Deltaproteobacteria bacterium]